MADEDHGPDYVGDLVRCRGCEARDAVARAARENANGDPLSGIHFFAKEVRTNGHS